MLPQLRGFMSHFRTLLMSTNAFERCSACSSAVVEKYVASGFDFLQQVGAVVITAAADVGNTAPTALGSLCAGICQARLSGGVDRPGQATGCS